MKELTSLTPPRALILCSDGRLSRLLETELAYLGVMARGTDTLPEADPMGADGELCLLVADGDEFPLTDCVALAQSYGCPLLVFGREVTSLPMPPESGVFLRRPFVLTDLADTLRLLLKGSAAEFPLWGVAPTRPSRQPVESPSVPDLLTVENGTVTVAGKPVPLTPAEWAIFECLYTRRGEAVSREELSTLLGGGGNSVDVYVCKLRTKIEKPLGRRIIGTVRGVGYRVEYNK